MGNFRFLACFAHPDDETFSCAGVMTLNHRRGIHNTLICATRGEAGEIADPSLATRENLGVVRAQELAEAGAKVGLDALHFLGFRDSGMAGTPENHLPGAYMQASAHSVVMRLVRFMREIRPHVVVTFDPNGGYGHPDHIAIHNHTRQAFHAAADPAYHPDLGEPWQAARLFYPALNRDTFQAIADELKAQGEEPPEWGLGEEEEGFWPQQPVHAKIDIRDVFDQKMAALTSHRTQLGPNHPFMRVSRAFLREHLGEEWFEMAWPERKPNVPLTDLFQGLEPDRDYQ